jgi:hypothetical protein
MSGTTTSQTTEYGRLLGGLDDCRWDHMRVLADAAEEAGDAELAAGWRWLAGNQQWPNDIVTDNDHFFFWDNRGRKEEWKKGEKSMLPPAVFRCLPAANRDKDSAYYESMAEALEAAARAAGEHLARQKAKPKRKAKAK